MIQFTCNICGGGNVCSPEQLHRELLRCATCGANARFRGIAHAVQTELLGDTATPLRAAQPMKACRGIGMSDTEIYAAELQRLFSYTNTYYHTTPRLDVTDPASAAGYRDLDFIISSDVLEHVHAPVTRALAHMNAMLKPGGVLILTVPYLGGYETIEHYPHLMEYRIVSLGDSYSVVNLRPDGAIEHFVKPSFHGGPGSVLELRIFGEGDLLAMLAYTGFAAKILAPALPDIGYIWNEAVESPLARGRKSISGTLLCRKI
jgi:SAM-dependent methyltransferase